MRNQLIFLFLFARIWCSAQTNDGSLYLLAGSGGRWCGFRSEQLWSAAKESMASAPLVARVEYASNRVAVVYVTSTDETGDWTVYDKYSLDKEENPESLERAIDVYGRFREEQLWSVRNGEATRQKSTGRSIDTNEIIPEGKIWYPSPAVIKKARAFPFWRLVKEKRAEVLSKGEVCEGGKE